MIRILFVSLLCLSIVSCAFAPKNETAKFESNLDYEKSKQLVVELVNKCWKRPRTFLGRDAIYGVESREGADYVMTLGYDNMDIPFMPFARIIIRNESEKTYLIVEEGDVFLRKKWGVDKSLRAWLEDSQECVK